MTTPSRTPSPTPDDTRADDAAANHGARPPRAEELPDLLVAGLGLFEAQVRAVRAQQWDDPTPCAGWTVRDLVGHVVSMLEAGTHVVAGTAPDAAPTCAVPVDEDPQVVADRVQGLGRELQSLLAGADLDDTRDTPAGPRPLAEGLAFPVADLAVHSWDLGTATGSPVELPTPLLAYTDAFCRSLPAELMRRPGVFGPEQGAPADASPTERLAAFLGRDIAAWRGRTPQARSAGAGEGAATAVGAGHDTGAGDGSGDAWSRLAGPVGSGTQEWVVRQLEQIDAAGTTDAVDVQGRPVMVVTMLGRRSGEPRRVPLMRVEHDGTYAAVASKGGAPAHPHWYHNLQAHPQVLVQDGDRVHRRVAREIHGAERSTWWARCVQAFPPYAEYEQRAGGRVIPVLLLEPVDAAR